jgi:hypothetical protein
MTAALPQIAAEIAAFFEAAKVFETNGRLGRNKAWNADSRVHGVRRLFCRSKVAHAVSSDT